MALNIEDEETQKLAREVAKITGDTELGAVREALREKKRRLEPGVAGKRAKGKEKPRSMQEWLETEIWPRVPKEELGKPLTKEEVEDILGLGPEGY